MEKTKIDGFAKNIKAYVHTQYELTELQLIDKTVVAGSSLLSRLVITSVIIISILFISLALGFYLAQWLHSAVLSFLIIGSFYLVIALILAVFRKVLLVNPLRNNIVKSLADTTNT